MYCRTSGSCTDELRRRRLDRRSAHQECCARSDYNVTQHRRARHRDAGCSDRSACDGIFNKFDVVIPSVDNVCTDDDVLIPSAGNLGSDNTNERGFDGTGHSWRINSQNAGRTNVSGYEWTECKNIRNVFNKVSDSCCSHFRCLGIVRY